jgi:hypothetical protein
MGRGRGERSTKSDTPQQWELPVFIRNSSELPVRVWTAELTVTLPAVKKLVLTPGTIAPGKTWEGSFSYPKDPEDPIPFVLSVDRVLLTDAAGRLWEIRPYRGGPPRRIRRWQLRWRAHREPRGVQKRERRAIRDRDAEGHPPGSPQM